MKDLDRLILEYLVVRGHYTLVRAFAEESGLADAQLPTIVAEAASRAEVVSDINEGRIDSALERLNSMDPNFLQDCPSEHFELRRYQLAQRIASYPNGHEPKDTEVAELIEFAQIHLLPLIRDTKDEELHSQLTHKLEAVMALMMYPSVYFSDSARLFELEDRKKFAEKINSVLLARNGIPGVARLTASLQARKWLYDQRPKDKRTRHHDQYSKDLANPLGISSVLNDFSGDTSSDSSLRNQMRGEAMLQVTYPDYHVSQPS